MKKVIGKLLCKIGIHKFICSLEDCIEEFGFIPNDGRMPKDAECERCSIKFGK